MAENQNDIQTHPGVAFSKVFVPTEQPPQVVETHNLLRAKIAGEVGFNPVTKMNLSDKKIYVRPVRNTQVRPVSLGILGTEGSVKIRRDQEISLAPELHSQIKARANSVFSTLNKPPVQPPSSGYVNSRDVEKQPTPAGPSIATTQQELEDHHNYNEQIKAQLDQINRILFEQIKQRVAQEIARQKTQTQGEKKAVLEGPPKLPYAKPVPLKAVKETLLPTPIPVAVPELEKKFQENLKTTVRVEHTLEEYKNQITKLEEEIKYLVKEVEDLDRTFNIAKAVPTGEVQELEKRVQIDERVLKTAENWRRTLTNLVNSHSIALKHLKQKTDWLEEKTLHKKPSHQQKHATHRRPNDLEFDFEKLRAKPDVGTEIQPETKTEPKPQGETVPTMPTPLPTAAEKSAKESVGTEAKTGLESVESKSFENVRDLLRQLDETKAKAPPPIILNLEGQPIANEEQPKIKAAEKSVQTLTTENTAQPPKNAPPIKRDEKTIKLGTSALFPTDNKFVVNIDDLKPVFEQIKSRLTTIDPQSATQLTGEQRQEMLNQLQQLERDSHVLAQFNELQAVQEKRRINAELQKMFSQLNLPPTSAVSNRDKIEALKQEQKKFTSPAEKARIIAEIKELERQEQQKKAQEAPKPIVKAQPAYGKMLPNTPTIPNVINGIIKDPNGLLLPSVVIIVKNKENEPVRAFRANKLGQFILTTPVPNGTYTLELEKDGYDFDIIEVEANGSIMQPIEVRAKAVIKP